MPLRACAPAVQRRRLRRLSWLPQPPLPCLLRTLRRPYTAPSQPQSPPLEVACAQLRMRLRRAQRRDRPSLRLACWRLARGSTAMRRSRWRRCAPSPARAFFQRAHSLLFSRRYLCLCRRPLHNRCRCHTYSRRWQLLLAAWHRLALHGKARSSLSQDLVAWPLPRAYALLALPWRPPLRPRRAWHRGWRLQSWTCRDDGSWQQAWLLPPHGSTSRRTRRWQLDLTRSPMRALAARRARLQPMKRPQFSTSSPRAAVAPVPRALSWQRSGRPAELPRGLRRRFPPAQRLISARDSVRRSLCGCACSLVSWPRLTLQGAVAAAVAAAAAAIRRCSSLHAVRR